MIQPPDPAASASERLGQRLNEILEGIGEASLPAEIAARFGDYAALLMRWNMRMNLTAVRDEEGILRRHFVESIVCARALPPETRTLLDFGSGAGFPGLPIALCRGEIAVTLAESQGKKAAFLREALRVLELSARVHDGRAEELGERFDCVTLRAVDRMGEAVRDAAGLVADNGCLALLTTKSDEKAVESWAGAGFHWKCLPFPEGSDRILLLGEKQSVPRGTV